MEVKVLALTVLIVLVAAVACKCLKVASNALERRSSLKLVETCDHESNKVFCQAKRWKLLQRAANLLIQSDVIDRLEKEVSEDEILVLSMSYRLERNAVIKQLQSSGVIEDRKTGTQIGNN